MDPQFLQAKWDRCDRDSYRRSIRENLLPFDAFHLSTDSNIDILEPLSHLNAVLKKATYLHTILVTCLALVLELRLRLRIPVTGRWSDVFREVSFSTVTAFNI